MTTVTVSDSTADAVWGLGTLESVAVAVKVKIPATTRRTADDPAATQTEPRWQGFPTSPPMSRHR